MEAKSRVVQFSQVTTECWSVQQHGLGYCERCVAKDAKHCGGRRIRETGRNQLGFLVPLGRPIGGDQKKGEGDETTDR